MRLRQAQYREWPQTVTDMPRRRGGNTSRRNRIIYLQPIDVKINGHSNDHSNDSSASSSTRQEFYEKLLRYVDCYYDSVHRVALLPTLEVEVDVDAAPTVLSSGNQIWKGYIPLQHNIKLTPHQRNKFRVNFRKIPGVTDHGQLCSGDLLHALNVMITTKRKKGKRKRKGSGSSAGSSTVDDFPTNAQCVLGVTMCDLFIDEGDVFTQGLAGGTFNLTGVGVFSFFRSVVVLSSTTLFLFLFSINIGLRAGIVVLMLLHPRPRSERKLVESQTQNQSQSQPPQPQHQQANNVATTASSSSALPKLRCMSWVTCSGSATACIDTAV